MAFVQRPHEVIWRWRDNDGAESTHQHYISQNVAIEAALQFAASMAAFAQPLSDAALITYNVVVNWVETSTPIIEPVSNVRRAGVFVFETNSYPFERYIFAIPSFRQELLKTDGDFAGIAIDSGQADVSAFIAAMADGIAGMAPIAPWEWTDADLGGGGGPWGGGGGGGNWGAGGGGGGPWGIGGGGGPWGSQDWLDDFKFTTAPTLRTLRTAYLGYRDERLHLSVRRI